MTNFVIDLEVERVDLVDEGDNSAAFIRLYKRKEQVPNMLEDILAKMDKTDADVIRSEVAKAKAEVPAETAEELAKAKEEKDAAEGKFQAAFDEGEVMKSRIKVLETPKTEEPSFEEVLKSLDPSVQKVMKAINDQKIAAEAVAKQLSDKALHDEAVAKVSSLKSIPVEEATLVEVVKNASPETMEVLKAANKAIEESVPFEETGKSKANAASNSKNSDAAWEKIEKRADAIKLEKSISKEAAIKQAVQENPELYKEYLKGGAN